jgi:hypothetical protein
MNTGVPGTRGSLEVDLVAGLGNRLIALTSVLANAQLASAKLTLRWKPEADICPCEFGDLFEPISSYPVSWEWPSLDDR